LYVVAETESAIDAAIAVATAAAEIVFRNFIMLILPKM
jgi:hypothetical protein